MNNPTAPFGSGPSINQIIDTYGGNKQKIAQAIQMGIVDPTKGLLAGMQIDRVRGAAAAEKAPPTTVAQQTFNPAPPAPPPPPQGAPPQQMASAPPPPPPQGAPPQMAARGGIMALAGGGDASQRAINSLRYNTDQNYSLSAPGWLDHMYFGMGDGSRRAFRNSNQNSRGDEQRLHKVVPGGRNRVPLREGAEDYVHAPIMGIPYWNKLVEERAMDQDETPYHMGEGDWSVEDLRKMKHHPPRWWGDSGVDHTEVDFPDEGHAGGGLIDLPLPDSMFNSSSFADGGIVAFKDGGVAEKKKRLYAMMNDRGASSEERRAAAVALNSLYGQGSSDVGLPDLSPITSATYNGPRGMDLVNSLIPDSPQSSSGSIYSPSGGSAGPSYDPYLAKASMDVTPEANPYDARASLNIDSAPDYSAPGWYGVGAKGNRGSIPTPDMSGLGQLAGDIGNADAAGDVLHAAGSGMLADRLFGGADPAKFRASMKHMSDPVPSFSDRVKPYDGHTVLGDLVGSTSHPVSRAPSASGTEGRYKAPGWYGVGDKSSTGPSLSNTISRRIPGVAWLGDWLHSGTTGLVTSGGGAPPEPDMISPKSPDASLPKYDVAGLGALAAKQNTPPPRRTGSAPLGNGGSSRIPGGSSRTPGGSSATSSGTTDTGDSFQNYLKMVQGSHPKLDDDPDVKEFADSLKNNKDRLKADKESDMWTALAQIGFGMAGSKSPYFLQAVGEAGSAAMPGIQKAMEARRAEERDDLKSRAELAFKKNGLSRDDAKQAAEMFVHEQDSKRDYQGKIDAANIAGNFGIREASIRASAENHSPAAMIMRYGQIIDDPNSTPAERRDARAALKSYTDVTQGPASDRNANAASANRIRAISVVDPLLQGDKAYRDLKKKDPKAAARQREQAITDAIGGGSNVMEYTAQGVRVGS